MTQSENLPRFSVEGRLELRRAVEERARLSQARALRVFARMLFAVRAREAQSKVVQLEDAAVVGRLWTGIGLGFKKVFRLVTASRGTLDQAADLAREQLDRLVGRDGPFLVQLADEAARAIEQDENAPRTKPGNGASAVVKVEPAPAPSPGWRWG